MRSLFAATAAVSAALLLTACAGPDSVEPAADSSPTPEASTETEGAVDIATTCAGYYDGGELSIDHRVTTWTPEVSSPATEENTAELTIVRDRLDAQIRYADTGPAAILQAIQEPFDDALNGTSGDQGAVEDAVTALEAMCDDAGFVRPE
ncbi:hypothetical protein [Isoptericola haloaureus]|uniref:Lipoprotein n=1 Tax=Isoptericola haloaureus TaxID=1542902 RepID=A0ABU7Z8A3_9MICO